MDDIVTGPTDRPRRSYHSPTRERQAAETRRRVLETAATVFLDAGWEGATTARIASVAGVSSDTVALVGTKSHVLLEAFRQRALGREGGGDIRERDDAARVFALTDPGEALDGVVDYLARLHARSAGLWLLVRASARTDEQVAEVFAELTASRDASHEITLDWLLGLGALGEVALEEWPAFRLRAGLVMSAEYFVQLTSDWGWTEARYRAWLAGALPVAPSVSQG